MLNSMNRRRALAAFGAALLAPAVARAQPPRPAIGAVMFDALGTLFDTAAVEAEAIRLFPERGLRLTQIWRLKQLEYTWLAAASGQFTPLATLNRQALGFAADQCGVSLSDEAVAALLGVYAGLPAFADVAPGLTALKGRPMGILSASGPALLKGLVERNHLDGLLTQLISTEPARTYKPAPQAYALATKALGLPAERILFVSSNGFDAWGAKQFGFRSVWLDRGRAARANGQRPISDASLYGYLREGPEGLTPAPDHVVTDMRMLAPLAV
jgi:2-haloacid dehalogenase